MLPNVLNFHSGKGEQRLTQAVYSIELSWVCVLVCNINLQPRKTRIGSAFLDSSWKKYLEFGIKPINIVGFNEYATQPFMCYSK